MVRRGLERDKYVARRRRREVCGAAEAAVARREEASGGKGRSVSRVDEELIGLRA